MSPTIEDVDRLIDVNRFLMSFYWNAKMPLQLTATFIRHLRLVYIRTCVIMEMS